MISYDCNLSKNSDLKVGIFSFNGLSTDTKPTGNYDGAVIRNGSTFMEMDKKKLYFYDEDGGEWV